MKTYYPAAEWCGRLIFNNGQAASRTKDGSVLFECFSAPEEKSYLEGKILRLSIDRTSPWNALAQSLAADVTFDSETEKSISEGENNHPHRLNGLKNISPLESLAGAHSEDDVLVALDGVTVYTNISGESELFVSREPVQISGFEKALVSFTDSKNIADGKISARHYNKLTRDYSGKSEEFIISRHSIFPKALCLQSSLEKIENEKMNAYGWYIYTVPSNNNMREITAIEPRVTMSLNSLYHIPVHTDEKFKELVSENMWKNFPHGTFRIRKLFPDTKKNAHAPFVLGERFLVMHIFGWRGGEHGDVLTEKQRITGHFALGTSRVVKDPFTDELRFDTRYYQAYAHNRENIIAGTMQSHHFLGNLKRGWMFTVPVTDALFRMPAAAAPVDEIQTSLLDYFELYLSKVTARMRVGYGNAVSPVNASISCSQETAMAMVDACRSFLAQKRGKTSPQMKINYRSAARIAHVFLKFYRPFRMTPPRWKKYYEGRPVSSIDWTGRNLAINAVLAWRSVLPIVHFKGLLVRLHTFSDVIVISQTYQAGGITPGCDPVMPTNSFNSRRWKESLGESGSYVEKSAETRSSEICPAV